MISETALCLLDPETALRPGIWTPGAALGAGLIERLTAYAGIELSAAMV